MLHESRGCVASEGWVTYSRNIYWHGCDISSLCCCQCVAMANGEKFLVHGKNSFWPESPPETLQTGLLYKLSLIDLGSWYSSSEDVDIYLTVSMLPQYSVRTTLLIHARMVTNYYILPVFYTIFVVCVCNNQWWVTVTGMMKFHNKIRVYALE